MENSFQAVVDRLIAACALQNEKALAELLGFQPAVFATRKMRDSLPRTKIDALIQERGFNSEWVYEGRGLMFVGKTFAEQRALLADIHERLELFALNERQRRYMAKLQLAFETADPLRLKELLDESHQLSAEEAAWLKGLRSAPPELLIAMNQLAKLADRLNEGKQGATREVVATKQSAIPDPETARMKPAEKRRYLAARKKGATK
ncbi:MAG: hypothetical protein EPN61_14835 [Burkholderiaceae bacterium]|nr:MAG: hypothetical protein EPN61_14835 [Burkholderiaceae bacterium]